MFSRNILSRTLYSPDGDPSGAPNPPVVPNKADIDAAVERRIAEILGSKKADNDPMAALQIAVRQNAALELRAATAERERDEARGQAASEADKAELAAYREKGKLEDIDAWKQGADKATLLERQKVTSDAAALLKLDPSKRLFNTLLGDVEFELQGEGEARKALVKTEKGAVSFEDYAKTRPELEEALPLLGGAVQVEPDRRPAYLRTAPVGGGKAVNTWDKIREEKKAQKKEATPAPWQEQVGVRPISASG